MNSVERIERALRFQHILEYGWSKADSDLTRQDWDFIEQCYKQNKDSGMDFSACAEKARLDWLTSYLEEIKETDAADEKWNSRRQP